jgi:hypothetical protein
MDKMTFSSDDAGIPAGLKILQVGSPATLRQHLGLGMLLTSWHNYKHMPIIVKQKKFFSSSPTDV